MKGDRRFSYKVLILIIIIIGILVYQFWYKKCGLNNNGAHLPSVSVITIKPESFSLTSEYMGRVSASKEVDIRPRVSGILLHKLYKEGQFVKQNTPLFELDSDQLKEEVKKADAGVRLAKHNLDRAEKLFRQKVISSSEYDKALSEYQQSDAALRLAVINLEYAVVKAPIDGLVSNSEYSEGNLLQANQSLIAKVIQVDPCYIEFGYSDKDSLFHYINKNREQLKIGIVFDNGEVYQNEGSIDYIDNMIDKETGIIKARGIITNPEGKLKPGQFVKVIVKGIDIKDAIVISDRSIMQGPQGTFVYTVTNENKVAIKPVALGALVEKGRIIEQGLSVGDKVITEGMIKVYPEQTVKTE